MTKLLFQLMLKIYNSEHLVAINSFSPSQTPKYETLQ